MRAGKNARSGKYRAFGRAVRESRARRGLSQEGLGFASGLHRNYVGAVERGEINPTLRVVFKLARGLAMLPSELLELAERHHGAVEDGGRDAA
jgi:transcriptional regulator with XRE-family HTH domain